MRRLAMLVAAAAFAAPLSAAAIQTAETTEDIVVTARRPSQRIEREPVSNEPPLGRAEMGLFGKVKGNLHVESEGFGNGTVSQRVMVGIKLPF